MKVNIPYMDFICQCLVLLLHLDTGGNTSGCHRRQDLCMLTIYLFLLLSLLLCSAWVVMVFANSGATTRYHCLPRNGYVGGRPGNRRKKKPWEHEEIRHMKSETGDLFFQKGNESSEPTILSFQGIFVRFHGEYDLSLGGGFKKFWIFLHWNLEKWFPIWIEQIFLPQKHLNSWVSVNGIYLVLAQMKW